MDLVKVLLFILFVEAWDMPLIMALYGCSVYRECEQIGLVVRVRETRNVAQ